MSFQRDAFMLLVLLCFTQLYNVDAKLEFTKKSHDFPGKYVQISRHSVDNGNLIFAVCELQGVEKTCTFVHQKYPYNEITHTCNATFRIPKRQRNKILYYNMYVRPLGEDKALLVWDEQEKDSSVTYIKFTTMKMSDCVISSEIKIYKSDEYQLDLQVLELSDIIVTYDDYYNLFVRNKNSLDYDVSQVRVDSRTGLMKEIDFRIGYVSGFLKSIFPIARGLPENSYVYNEHYEDNYRVSIIKSDGSQKLLENYDYHSMQTLLSVNHHTIGSCVTSNDEEDEFDGLCNQYDENGQLLSTTALKNITKGAILLDMHMLPNGGFLLTLAELKLVNNSSGYLYVNFRIIRVDSRGQVTGNLHLKQFDYFDVGMEAAGIYEIGQRQYCSTVIGRYNEFQRARSHLDIASYCFTEEDFDVIDEK